MSQKKLNEQNIVNELKGNSAFFPAKPETPLSDAPGKDAVTAPVLPLAGQESDQRDMVTIETNNKLLRPEPIKKGGKPVSQQASTLARYPDSLIDGIRKTVKSAGKEVSFVRLTPEEKNQIVDIVYTYKRQGVKTSENEINRIAVNFLLEDYQANGSASILARVIEALLA